VVHVGGDIDAALGVIPDQSISPLLFRLIRIVGPLVFARASVDSGHDPYQDAEAFITNGGHKGLQEQVILAGRYFINPRFATVETKPMTDVPIANVGVVIAYVGEEGKDQTGDTFKHGNLVSRGQKGVWCDPLDPGKYPINPFTHKVEIVPTANIVLNWATGRARRTSWTKSCRPLRCARRMDLRSTWT
jgi:uncharacterized membrane protein YqiK